MAPNPKPPPAPASVAPTATSSAPREARPEVPDEVDDLRAFPLPALGSLLHDTAYVIAALTQAPEGLAAANVLAVAALAAQGHVAVRLPIGPVRPVSCYILTAAESGERRSAVRALAHAPFDLCAVPRAPVSWLYTENSADLMGRSVLRRGSEAARLAALWDGEGPTVGGVTPRLSAHLVVSPQEAQDFFADAKICAQGLSGRVLAAAPPSRIGLRQWRTVDPGPHPALTVYTERVCDLLTRAVPGAARVLSFSPTATEVWLTFANTVERAMRSGGVYAPIRGFATRLPEHAARLAAIVALFDDPRVSRVEESALDAGIALARYYAAQACGFAAARTAGRDSEHADQLLQWLRRTRGGQAVSLREIYREGPAGVRGAAVAKRLMAHLQHSGFVTAKHVRGGRYVWEVEKPESQVSHDVA